MVIGKVSNCREPLLKKGAPLAAVLLLVSALQGQALAQAKNIDFLASEIIKRQLHLQSLNLSLHQQSADLSFNRARRTWLWDFGNAIPTEGGLIAATALFYSHSTYRPNNHIPGSKIAATLDPQIAGQVIGGLGAYFELAGTLRHSIQTHKKGLTLKTISNKIVTLKKEIDALQIDYDAQAIKQTERQLYLAEANVLRDISNNNLNEFIRLQKSAAFISRGQLTEDTIGALRNTVGGVGNSINVAAALQNNKRLNGQADILNLIAASMITTRPVLSNLAALVAKKNREKSTKKLLGLDGEKLQYETEDLRQDFQLLNTSASANSPDAALTKRLAVYRAQLASLGEQQSLAAFEQDKLKTVATRRFRETIYGPTKMSQSVLGIVIGLRSQNNATHDYQLAAGGNVTYASGQVFNICELVRQRIIDEADHSKLQTSGMLPGQRLEKQAQRLEEMKNFLQ